MIGRLVSASGIAASLSLLAGIALADAPLRGSYVSLSAGAMWLQDIGAEGLFRQELQYDTGFTLNGALGYRFGNGFRVEGEIGYARASIDRIMTTFGTPARFSGVSANLYSATVNAFYDINVNGWLRPYVGAGIGFVHARVTDGTVSGNAGVGGSTPPASIPVSGSSETDLTALAEVGISIALAPRWELVPAYRFQWVNSGGNGLDDDKAHIAKIGLRYSF